MGYAISWIAFKDKSAAEIGEVLALSLSGESSEVPEGKFSGARLGTGWYLIVINEYGHKYVSERSLRESSSSADVVAATIEEHVMSSSAEAWKGGKRIWKVTHEGESGRTRHLGESGVLPEEYGAIKARLIAAQDKEDAGEREVDYFFEVPLELAEAVVGFKHDKALKARFEVLNPAPGGGGLIFRLLGRTRR
jgi:hypothetical protein